MAMTRLACLALCGLLCASGLEDCSQLVQKALQVQGQDPDRTVVMSEPEPEPAVAQEEAPVQAPQRTQKHRKSKVAFNPFKDMIDNINLAIVSLKDGLTTSTRDLVHQTAADLKTTGEQISHDLHDSFDNSVKQEVQRASIGGSSLLEFDEETGSQREGAAEGAKAKAKARAKARKTKVKFNPFQSMVDSVNFAIDSFKSEVESSARDLLHSTSDTLKTAGEEIAKGLSANGAKEQQIASLLEFDEETAPQREEAEQAAKEKAKAKSKKHRVKFNPFKNLVDSVNFAIDNFRSEVESSARDLLRSTSDTLKTAGEEIASGFGTPGAKEEVKPIIDARQIASLIQFDEETGPQHEAATHEGKAKAKAKAKREKVKFNPFKSLVDSVNFAIDSFKSEVEGSARDLLRSTSDTLKTAGEEIAQGMGTIDGKEPAKPIIDARQIASLLEFDEETSTAPQREQATQGGKAKAKRAKKTKVKFNPFQSMVDSVNFAIDSFKSEVESSARDLLRSTSDTLRTAGEEIAKGMGNPVEAKPADTPAFASLLSIDQEELSHPTARARKQKIKFNPFEGMIKDINAAIGTIKEDIVQNTRKLVHNAAAEVKEAGEQLSKEMPVSLYETMERGMRTASEAERKGI